MQNENSKYKSKVFYLKLYFLNADINRISITTDDYYKKLSHILYQLSPCGLVANLLHCSKRDQGLVSLLRSLSD